MSDPSTQPQAFASAWIRALQRAEPLAMVGRSEDPLALHVDLPGGARVSAHLHALWEARHSSDVPALLQADVQSLMDFRAPHSSQEWLRAHLRPVVLRQEALHRVAPHNLGDWPVAGTLQVLLTIEADGRSRPVLAEERLLLGARPLRVAIANLVDAVGNPTYTELGHGLWRVVLDDRQESSMLLVAGLWNLLEEKLGGTLMLAHPTPELLLCAAESDPEGMAALQATFNEALSSANTPPPHPSLLRWADQRWTSSEPARRCGVCSWSSATTSVRCASCGTPLDEDRFLAWSVGSALLGAAWVMLERRLGLPPARPALVELVMSGAALGALGFGVSLLRARLKEPWRLVLADTEANLLDRTVRVPLVVLLALGWAALPALAPSLVSWPEAAPTWMGILMLVRAWVLVTLIIVTPGILILRHGYHWLDPRPASTLDPQPNTRQG